MKILKLLLTLPIAATWVWIGLIAEVFGNSKPMDKFFEVYFD